MIFGVAFFALATTITGKNKDGLCYEGKTVSFVLSFTSHMRDPKRKKYPHTLYYPNILPLLPSMVRHNHDANVPPANARLFSEAQSELKREESDNNARNKADLANAFAEEEDCVTRYRKLVRRKKELLALKESHAAAKREESENARINVNLANALAEEKDCEKRLIELLDRKNELFALKQSHAAAKSFKEANVPPEQRQPSPDSYDFDVEEGVGSTEGNSQTNDDNTTTARKFNALEKRLDLLEEDVMDLQMNNDKMVLAYAAAVPFVLTFAIYCLRHFASSMSRD